VSTRIVESVRLAEAPDVLWRQIGSFGAVGRWHPLLTRVDSEGESAGCRRTAEGQDGSRQVERLLESSPQRRFYRYRMETTRMPVRDYVGELRVENDGESGSTVVWSADFEPSGADEARVAESVHSFISAGLHNLERVYRVWPGDFEEFFARRTQAAEAYTQGDYAPLAPLVAREGQASFHSPRGDTVTGAQAVEERYRSDARGFRAGGGSRFEVLQRGASGDLGFWSGFQLATVRVGSSPAPIEMRIRVTEVFRRVDGEWKLVHRHADPARS
jgi:mxaD protein